ncbi:TPA: Rop family plasmid primer RNA-binding protein [Escherichia coli]|nr:Rop family plasmid primer RNA-binding protein [Escherichia coli]
MCESLHDCADNLYCSCLERFGEDGDTPKTHLFRHRSVLLELVWQICVVLLHHDVTQNEC